MKLCCRSPKEVWSGIFPPRPRKHIFHSFHFLIIQVLVYLCVLPAAPCSAQQKSSIIWSEHYSLNWSDFQGLPDSSSGHAAVTRCRMVYETTRSGDSIRYTVYCCFNKLKSWRLEYMESPSLLLHEQGHFDLAEYYTRKLRQVLYAHTRWYPALSASVKKSLDNILAERTVMNALYDAETEFSVNEASQLRWTDKIRSMLTSLNHFK